MINEQQKEDELLIDVISEELEEDDIQFEDNDRKYSRISASMRETHIRNFSIENEHDLSLS